MSVQISHGSSGEEKWLREQREITALQMHMALTDLQVHCFCRTVGCAEMVPRFGQACVLCLSNRPAARLRARLPFVPEQGNNADSERLF